MGSILKKFNFTSGIKFFIFLILIVTIIVPLCFMFSSLGTINFSEIFLSSKFLNAMKNSILSGLVATIFSMLFAFILAYCVSKSNIKHKNILSLLFTIPMLIPSISHGMGIVVLFGDNGFFTNVLGLNKGILGFWGIILGAVMYSFPTAYLMFKDILDYEDLSIYQAADIMGIPKNKQFFDLTVPYLKQPLISIFFAVFTMVFTDYGVPMMVGGRYITLPLYMYNAVIGQLNFGKGAVVSIVLLIPAVVACLFSVFTKKTSQSTNITNKNIIKQSKSFYIISKSIIILSLIIVLLPIISFSIFSFIKKYPIDMSFTIENFSMAFNMHAGEFWINSILIALCVGMIGTLFSYSTAYITARGKSKFNLIIHFLCLSSLAIPGIVLGISYSSMFSGTIFIGTVFLLIIVNCVHFFASPYLMCYNALEKVNPNYEIVTETLGISKFRYIIDILVPETSSTIIEMFSYFFVNSMVTISAVAFLVTSKNMPLALLINNFENQLLIECAAVVSEFILITNLLLKGLIFIIKKILWRKNNVKQN